MAEIKLPPNSFAGKGTPAKTKQGPPKMEKVVQNEVQLKKPSKAEKLKASASSAAKNVMVNTIGPSIKDMILNAVWTGLSMIFFPDGSRKPNYNSTLSRFGYNPTYTSYGNYYYGSKPKEQVVPTVTSLQQVFQNPIFETMTEAKDVVDKIQEVINTYGFATWATLYEFCSIDSANWQGTNKYGWVSVVGNRIATVNLGHGRMGYELIMPKAMPVDDLQIDPPPFD